MISFKNYIEESVTLIPIDDGHISTHTPEKKRVVENERSFFEEVGADFTSSGKVLGVVGNFDGWNDHVSEWRQYGFMPDEMMVCEKDKKYFGSLLYGYITNLLGMDIEPGEYPPGAFFKPFTQKGIIFGYDNKRENIVFIKAPNQPGLLLGEITGSGVKPVIPYGIIVDGTKRPLKEYITDYISKVEFLDFDVTSKLKTDKELVSNNMGFYSGFRNLKALVQVHFGQRSIQSSDEIECERASEAYNRYDFASVTYISDDEKRRIKSVIEISYSCGTKIEVLSEYAASALSDAGRSIYIQIYPSASKRNMISVATTKKGGVRRDTDYSQRENLGQEDINKARTALNKIKTNEGLSKRSQFLEQILDTVT